MIDTNIYNSASAIFQDQNLTSQQKARLLREYMELKSQREQEEASEIAAPKVPPKAEPAVPEKRETEKFVVVEPSAVHVEKEQKPVSINEVTAEIIELNRQISDEFNAFEDDNTYTIVENYCLDNPNIGGREMAVYAMLARHCHMPKRTCKVSLVRLSERLGWKRDTINKALDNLTKFGLIERGERDNGGAYTYTLTHRHRSKKKEKKAA